MESFADRNLDKYYPVHLAIPC